MKRGTKIFLKNCFLVVSGLVTMMSFLRAADPDNGSDNLVWVLWGIGPYFLFWIMTWLLERLSSIRQVPGIGFGLSIVILVYALLVYLEPLNHKSSTEGLIFLFAPLWLYLLTLPALGICVLVMMTDTPSTISAMQSQGRGSRSFPLNVREIGSST
jgi:hypothetical protein